MAVGLLVGAGLALLYAPLEGRDARRAVHRRIRRLGYRGQDAWLDLRDELLRAALKAKRARRRSRLAAEELIADD